MIIKLDPWFYSHFWHQIFKKKKKVSHYYNLKHHNYIFKQKNRNIKFKIWNQLLTLISLYKTDI